MEEIIYGDDANGRIHDGLGEAEGDEQAAKEDVPSPWSFVDDIESLGELANETSASGGGRVVALGLFHVDVRDDVGIVEGRDDVHLLNLEIVVAC